MGILTGLTAAAADEGKKAQVKSAAASGGDEKADQWIALLQGLIDLRTAENPDSQMKGMTGAQLAAGMVGNMRRWPQC